ncbi:MAG: 2-oxoglutarate dehydrogenase, subunit, dihydrolipoamide succinyltransferase [Deltaproteobacteria bacterium]|jgi:2-oxoglutarate dehydrogenase E2 component (dihydrolipoamide succinyltransferase)|nr:2-oxoglutarate dehydrogenase, subunit, dihydrolipoamide succinyltransferase [Deltaproteobacteria bacterium]
MTIEVKVPEVGESITEVEIGDWLKAVGDSVQQDEDLVVIETDKATVEILAPQAGRLSKILKASGETAQVGEVIGHLDQAEHTNVNGAGEDQTSVAESSEAKKPKGRRAKVTKPEQPFSAGESDSEDGPDAQPSATETTAVFVEQPPQQGETSAPVGPTQAAEIELEARPSVPDREAPSEQTRPAEIPVSSVARDIRSERQEKLLPMSQLRRRLAERLVQAQQTAALLTTFNEIDMSAVNQLRQIHQDAFKEKYNVRLGLMSFFVRAAIEALKLIPEVNAEIRDGSIVYRNYFDIGVAVGGGRGLVVPVLRDAQSMSFAAIEIAIGDFARRARENKLKPDELQGGTFTITNGGVYGSLLSTPIINPPQSAILGMHAMQERPVARDGAVVIRPMMYVALSYDHRLIDGREAVTFLKQIKTAVEEPVRMLLEL